MMNLHTFEQPRLLKLLRRPTPPWMQSMGTFFIIFMLLGRGVSKDPAVHYLMGCVGIMGALVLDTGEGKRASSLQRDTRLPRGQFFKALFHVPCSPPDNA